jgi:hypothetical protein
MAPLKVPASDYALLAVLLICLTLFLLELQLSRTAGMLTDASCQCICTYDLNMLKADEGNT